MIIAIVVPQFPPKWLGGAEIVTQNLAKQLSMRGHTVHVITSLDEGLTPKNFEDGYYIHRIKIPFPKIGMINYWLNIIKTIRDINPNIIHLQQFVVLGTGIPVLIAHIFLKKPYVISFHGFCVYGNNQSIYQKGPALFTVSNLIVKNAQALIGSTEFMRKKLIASSPNKKIYTVPHGIEASPIGNLTRETIRNDFFINDDEQILLFVGRLDAVKGLKYLVSAMKKIIAHDTTSRLIIVGNDHGEKKILEESIKKLHLEKNICFIENASHDKKFRYMLASDILILPSISEGLPLVLLEAMSCGIPIVASNIGGISEIIQDGRNGLLVQPGNPEDIAEKVLQLLKSEALRKKISDNNLNDVKKYFNESITTQMEQIYAQSL